MADRESEADRLRRCRMIFERAQSDGVSMQEAKARIAADAKRAKLESIRRTDELIADRGGHRASSEQPSRRGFWWQEGQHA